MFAEIKHFIQSHILVLILLNHQKFLLNTLIIIAHLTPEQTGVFPGSLQLIQLMIE